MPRSPILVSRSLAGLTLGLLALGCSNDSPSDQELATPASQPTDQEPAFAAPEVLPDQVVVADPTKPIARMDDVEDFSEEVANRFVDFTYELKKRNFVKAADWVGEDFVGQALFTGLNDAAAELPLETAKHTHDIAAAPVVDKAGWLADIAAGLGPWENVEWIYFKVKGAEFESGRPLWGKVKFKITMLGTEPGGGPVSEVAWVWARVEKRRSQWTLTALEQISRSTTRRHAPLFTEVSTSTGLAHTGIRFGKPGNTLFAWQGAAGGDVNGDGLWDLYLPSELENFLYLARPDGTFRDEAEAWGVKRPGGGTGSLFLDFDNDGDQDLFCADEGWEGPNGDRQGNPLRLYVNEGDRFVERGAELGFSGILPAYTLTALDYDSDGWVDVFISNYGVQNKENNNDWLDATNGGKNVLLRNLGGKGFEDVAASAGVDDGRWTYAAAAADFDGDGDADLSVANDYGVNALLENLGDGTFVDRAEEWGIGDRGNGMGTMWGDFNSDGRLDLYIANMSSTAGNRILGRMQNKDADAVQGLLKMAGGNSIFVQSEDGSFARQDKQLGGVGASWAWCPLAFDMDLDGHLDIYCNSGYVTGDTAADT